MPLIIDRTTITTDWQCRKMRWWFREEGGTGMVPVVEPVYFEDGRLMHEDLAALGEAVDPAARAADLAAEIMTGIGAADSFLDKERITWRAGMAAAYGTFVEPWLRGYYTHVSAEQEFVLRRGDLWVPCTPDRLMREIGGGGRLIYREYKSLKAVRWGWAEHWQTAPQLHIGLKAVEEETGERPAFAQIMGVIKGEWRDGRLRHPYVWAYRNEKTEEWTSIYSPSLTPTPVWEYPGGVVEWVKVCGIDTAWKVFPFSTPVGLDDRLVETLLREVGAREGWIAYARKFGLAADAPVMLDNYFPHTYERCQPVIGSRCVYFDACHNEEVGRDPLGSGLYKPRTPHHELEIIGVEE